MFASLCAMADGTWELAQQGSKLKNESSICEVVACCVAQAAVPGNSYQGTSTVPGTYLSEIPGTD